MQLSKFIFNISDKYFIKKIINLSTYYSNFFVKSKLIIFKLIY